jgi:hypothetical protein
MGTAKIDPRKFGAKADVWLFANASVNVSGGVSAVILVAANKDFQSSAATVGNAILIRDMSDQYGDISTTITGWDGDLTLTVQADLSNFVGESVTGLFGTDDSGAIQRAIEYSFWPSNFLANSSGDYGSITVEGPNNPSSGGTDSGDLWYNGPQIVILRSLGRNSSMFGIAAPIRIGGGVTLEFETPVHALPGFPSCVPMLGCLDNFDGTLVSAYIRNPYLVAMGLADYCMQIDAAYGVGITGYGRYFGARLVGVMVGPPPSNQMIGTCEVSAAGAGVGVISFTGTTRITNDRSVTRFGGTNDPTSVGFWWTAGAVDCAHNGDIVVCGYRTGYRDQGGNNKVLTVHCWSISDMGSMTVSHDISGTGSYIGKAVVDSPQAPSGTATCGVQFGTGGGNFIALVDSVFSPAVTVSEQCTLVVNTGQNTDPNRINMLRCSTGRNNNDPLYFAAVVSDPSDGGGLVIDQIIVDPNAIDTGSVGYVSLQSKLLTANSNVELLSNSVSTLETITPGALWTPQRIASSVALWVEADSGIVTDSSGNVASWTPHIGMPGAVPIGTAYFGGPTISASGPPAYNATGLDGVLPAVMFNATEATNQVLLFDHCIDEDNTDLSVFIVAKRLMAQNSTDRPDYRRLIGLPLNTNTGLRVYGFFSGPDVDTSQNQVAFSGSGAIYVTGWDVDQVALLELYATTTFIPDGAMGMGVTGGVTFDNARLTPNGDGAVASLPSTGSPLLTGITVGGAENPEGASIAISAIVIVQGTVTTDTAQKIMGYLADKWMGSTQLVLPTDNAYYKAPSANPLPDVTQYVGLSNTTVANTTIQATLAPSSGVGSLTIAANTLSPGKWFRLTAKGVYSTAASPGALTFALKAGVTTIATASLTLTGGLSDAAWLAEADIICRTSGASGTVVATGSAMGAPLNSGLSAVILDTTSSLTLDLDVSWGMASPSNIITAIQFTLEGRNWTPD